MEKNIEALAFAFKTRTKDWKESNVRFIKESIEILIRILNNRNINKRTLSLISPLIIEKIHENKYTENCINLLNLLVEKFGTKIFACNFLPFISSSTNIKTLIEIGNFLVKTIEKEDKINIPLKEIIEFSKICCNNNMQNIKNIGIMVLKTVYPFYGSTFFGMLTGEFNPQIIKTLQFETQKLKILKNIEGGGEKNEKSKFSDEPFSEKIDISNEILKISSKCNDSNWKIRKDGAEALENCIQNKIIYSNNIGELVEILKNKLNDPNKNVLKAYISLSGKFAESCKDFKLYGKMLIIPLLNNLSDKNNLIRNEVLNSIDKFAKILTNEFVINYSVPLLISDSNEIKVEILKWLVKNLQSFEKAEVV